MKKEKYLSKIDNVLSNLLSRKSKSLADRDVILFSDDLVEAGHVRKIAFDVYKVDNDPYEDLWITQDIDGQPHLVRAVSDESVERKENNNWTAFSDHQKENITLSYKNVPITRFSSDEYGFSSKDIITFKSALLDRLGTDNDFIKEIFAEQPNNKREALAATFPELQEIIKG